MAFNNQNHVFFLQHQKNRNVPEWFLENATRQEAEGLLSSSTGNFLMRKHTSFTETGRYVVSHRNKSSSFKHYVVMKTPAGFLLDIDHKKNHTVNCLSEVIELFAQLAGSAAKPIGHDVGPDSDYLQPVNEEEHDYLHCTDGGHDDDYLHCTDDGHDDHSMAASAGIARPVVTPQSYVNASEMNSADVSRSQSLRKPIPGDNYINQSELPDPSRDARTSYKEKQQLQGTSSQSGYVNMQAKQSNRGSRDGWKNWHSMDDKSSPVSTPRHPPPPSKWNRTMSDQK